ncbi:uncharacterized protein [Salvelinus alpinus]|uniref:uncharacterized protein isoform X2 n=1 Tax=Salvelinus alpinus TaxID=8036 RepID=UPI0039FD4BC4
MEKQFLNIAPFRIKQTGTVTIVFNALPTASVKIVTPQGLLYPGETVTLQRDISDYTDWTYRWFRYNKEPPIQTRKTITISLPDQAGQYQCVGMRRGRPQKSYHSSALPIIITGEDRLPWRRVETMQEERRSKRGQQRRREVGHRSGRRRAVGEVEGPVPPVPAPRTRPPVRLQGPVRPVPAPRTRPEVRVPSPVPPVPAPRTRPIVRLGSPVRPVPPPALAQRYVSPARYHQCRHHAPGLQCASAVQYALFLLLALALRSLREMEGHTIRGGAGETCERGLYTHMRTHIHTYKQNHTRAHTHTIIHCKKFFFC